MEPYLLAAGRAPHGTRAEEGHARSEERHVRKDKGSHDDRVGVDGCNGSLWPAATGTVMVPKWWLLHMDSMGCCVNVGGSSCRAVCKNVFPCI